MQFNYHSKFTKGFNNHHNLVLEHFHCSKKILHAINPRSHSQSPATANLLSISIDLLFLDILHKCTHIIYCLSPNFRGKNIQSFTNKYDAGYRFFIESPYKLRKFFSISSYWDFYHEWMLGIIKCFFFVCIEMIMCFFSVICIILLKLFYSDWLLEIKPTLYSWKKSHLVWCRILFICCWIHFASIHWGFLHPDSGITISISNFLVTSLSGLGMEVILTSWN